MNKHHVELECLYQDLFDRYGADDSVVRALQEEISVQTAKAAATPHDGHAQSPAIDRLRNHARAFPLRAGRNAP